MRQPPAGILSLQFSMLEDVLFGAGAFREERIQDGVVLEASRVKVENYFIISIIS